MIRPATIVAVWAIAATILAGCGGPSAEQARRDANDACTAAGRVLKTLPVAAGPGRMGHMVAILSAYNALDARLDAIGATGETGRRMGRLRRAVLDVRTAFVSQYGISTRPPGQVRAEPIDAGPAFAVVDAQARSLGVPACASSRLGRPLYAAYARTMIREAAQASPTGDFAADVGAACRALPRSMAVPRRVSDASQAQAWALRVRASVVEFSLKLRDTPGPPLAREAARHARGLLAEDAAVLSSYAEAVSTGSLNEAQRAADAHARLVKEMLATLAHVGVECRR